MNFMNLLLNKLLLFIKYEYIDVSFLQRSN